MTDIRGFLVTANGTYVLMDDVVAAIREYAQSLEDANDGAAVHALAGWLVGGDPEPVEVHGAEADDVTLDVDRVEVYPVETPSGLRWHARSIDTGGFILKTTGGSFDQEWVIRNAAERWPGVNVHLLSQAGEDSKWIEDGTRGVFPSKGPPVRRLFAGVNG